MKIIDCEFHYYLPELMEYLSTRDNAMRYYPETKILEVRDKVFAHFDGVTNEYPVIDELMNFGAERVAVMDKNGIDVAVMSTSPALEKLPEKEKVNKEKIKKCLDNAKDFLLKENYKSAIKTCEKVLEEEPENEVAYNNLGIAYYGLGKFTKAIECYEQAIKIAPKYAKPYCNIGVIKETQGKISEAIEYYNKALSIDSTLEQANSNKQNADAKLKESRAAS